MENVNYPARYSECLRSKERENAIFEEAKFLKDTYHLNNFIKTAIVKHYLFNYHSKLGNVSKTIKFVDSILIYYGFSEEERTKFLTDNFRMYLSEYNDFRIRLAIFNKCGLFEEALFNKNRFLSKYSSANPMSIYELYAICARNSFSVTFDAIEHYGNINYNRQELIKKYSLTKEIMESMDKDLIDKIKSYQISRKLNK